MKKKLRKLELSKETVRRLGGESLKKAAGGGFTDTCRTAACPDTGSCRCMSNLDDCITVGETCEC